MKYIFQLRVKQVLYNKKDTNRKQTIAKYILKENDSNMNFDVTKRVHGTVGIV